MAKLTQAQLDRKLRELDERKKLPWDPDKILSVFQRRIRADLQRRRAIVIQATRQSGKTFFAACELIDAALTNPGSENYYVSSIDGEHASETISPIIERDLMPKYRIPAVLLAKSMQFENGSVIHFAGGQTEVQTLKVQGRRLKLAVCDESNDSAHLGKFISMTKPALMRMAGKLILMGIPGEVPLGDWYEVCEGDQADQYGQHRLSLFQNPALPDPQGDYDAEKQRLGKDDPEFLRHWRNKWVHNVEYTVYSYDPAINSYEGPAPKCDRICIGLDAAGVADREALVALGQVDGDPTIYEVEENVTEKGQGGGYDQTAEHAGEMDKRLNPVAKYWDYGSAKKALPLMYGADHQVYFEPVPFKDLDAETKRFNALLKSGRFKARKGGALERDLMLTQWDKKALAAGRHRYTSANHPDVADAARAALHGLDLFLEKPPANDTKDELEERRKRIAAEIAERDAEAANGWEDQAFAALGCGE